MLPVVIGKPHGLRIDNVDRARGTAAVELALPGLTASAVIHEYTERANPLVQYFQDLSDHWRGWSGAKEYESLEGDLRLSAQHTGHVIITAQLRSFIEPAEWTAEGEFRIDPGEELTGIAAALAETLR